VRELAQNAQQKTDGCGADAVAMSELMDYYNSVFGILANCAKRELDTMCFTPSATDVAQLFEDAKRYADRVAAKRGLDVTLTYEPTDASANVDAGLVAYLFEALIDAALKVEKSGTLLLRATSASDTIKIELVDNRRTLSSEEVAELFTPSRYNIGQRNELLGMEYLIAKEIVRMHEDYTGRHGSRMEARSDVEGTVILFTLPK
jgi:signal transduction histidine kinase